MRDFQKMESTSQRAQIVLSEMEDMGMDSQHGGVDDVEDPSVRVIDEENEML